MHPLFTYLLSCVSDVHDGFILLFRFFFFLMIRRPPRSTLFPYTTLSDLPRRDQPQASANKTAASGESPQPAEKPASARSRLLGARISERPPQDLKFFRKPITAADDLDMAPPQTAAPSRDAHNDYRGGKPHEFSDGREATWDHSERAEYGEAHDLIEDGSAPMHGLEQTYDLDDEQRIEPGRPRRPLEPADHYREPRP